MIRSFQYLITQSHKQCQGMIQFLEQLRRKGMQDIRGETPVYADPIYRSPHEAAKIPLQVIPRKLTDLNSDTLEKDINMDFEESFPYQ